MSGSGLLLTLVRHAKSSWSFAGMEDFHRPLNKRGLRDAVRMPKLVAARVPCPDLVLTSDASRAVQTCQAVVDGFGLDPDVVRVDHALYLAPAEDIMDVVSRAAGAARHVLVVGHNPGLTDLHNRLARSPVDNLPTLAVAHLELDAVNFATAPPGCARSALVLVPKELLGP